VRANRLLPLSVSTALVFTTIAIAAVVGCSSPDTGTIGAGDSNVTEKPAAKKPATKSPTGTSSSGKVPTGDDDDDSAAPKKKTAPPGTSGTIGGTSSSSSSGIIPGTSSSSSSGSSTSSTGGPAGDPEACVTSCLGNDQQAKQFDQCSMNCQDEQCATACLQPIGCTDFDNCAPVAKDDQCLQQCGIDINGGGPNGGPTSSSSGTDPSQFGGSSGFGDPSQFGGSSGFGGPGGFFGGASSGFF
jgi:hypothetical protein